MGDMAWLIQDQVVLPLWILARYLPNAGKSSALVLNHSIASSKIFFSCSSVTWPMRTLVRRNTK